MFTQQALGLMAISALASACAPELYKRDGVHPAHIVKRQHIPNVVEDTRGWTFDQSEEWNTQNPGESRPPRVVHHHHHHHSSLTMTCVISLGSLLLRHPTIAHCIQDQGRTRPQQATHLQLPRRSRGNDEQLGLWPTIRHPHRRR